ncbi:MAG: hypothetical protein AAGI38_16005 [Bacteroidota bacterium]
MKQLITICLCLMVNLVQGQFRFTDLIYEEVGSGGIGIQFGYPNSENFQYVNKWCDEPQDCFDYGEPTIFLGTWKRSGNSLIEFHFSEGPSADPTFIAIHQGRVIFAEGGNTFHIKGSTLYIEGSSNSYFDKKRKFILSDNTYREVAQPAYYIGAKGRLNYPISIFSDQNYTKKVASLPKGYEIEIVLGNTEEVYGSLRHLLIKSEFGLVGWFDFNGGALREPLIDGFIFMGD